MKKLLFALLLFTLSFTAYQTKSSAAELGTRANPFSAYNENTINFQRYSFETPKKIKLQLMQATYGPSINSVIASENMFNKVPASDEQYGLFEYKITYVSSSKDEELRFSDVIQYASSYFYYDKQFKSITSVPNATFGKIYGSRDLRSTIIYKGGSGTAFIAPLMKTSESYPYFRIQKANGEFYWFSTNPNYEPGKNTPRIDLGKQAVKVKLTKGNPTYSGKEVTPAATYTVKGKKLKINKDFTLTYKNNWSAGVATATMTGIGAYKGSYSYKFNIKPKQADIYIADSRVKNSAVILWNYASGAQYYKVFYTTGSKTKSKKIVGYSTQINNLQRNKTYTFRVVAYYNEKIYNKNGKTKAVKIK